MKIYLLMLFLLSCVAIYAMDHDFDIESLDDTNSELSEQDIMDTESLDDNELEDIDLDQLMYDNDNDMEE